MIHCVPYYLLRLVYGRFPARSVSQNAKHTYKAHAGTFYMEPNLYDLSFNVTQMALFTSVKQRWRRRDEHSECGKGRSTGL